MFVKNIKLIILLAASIIVVIFFAMHKKAICNSEYLKDAKAKKQIENIEICIKEDSVDAAVFLSKMYANGDTIPRNHSKAVEIIEDFVKSGYGDAIIQRGDLYSCYNEDQDLDKAEALYKKAIESGDNYSEKAKISLARFYHRRFFRTKDPKNIDTYIKLLETIANDGNTEAMRLLASEYQEGKYVKKDYHTALEWLKTAASKGDLLAHRAIGNYYANGFLGDADYDEAKYWFQKAADMGDNVSNEFLQPNPDPFGLEITKATVSDFKEKFTKYKKIDNPRFIDDCHVYLVRPEHMPIDGVKDDVLFVFNKNSTLDSVLIVFNRSKYSEIQSHLQSKYSPMIGGSNNTFTQGLTDIKLKEGYVFYTQYFTNSSNSEVCTLIYNGRAFNIKLLDKQILLQRESETKRKQRMKVL